MSDRPRARGIGGRGRGQPQGSRQPSQQQHHQQQPPQQFQQAPPPQQSAWGSRGRGAGGAPRTDPTPVEAMQAMSLGARGGNGSGGRPPPPSRDGNGQPPAPRKGDGENSRGARRQGPVPDPKPLLDSGGNRKPKQGESGQPITLKANYFQLRERPDMTLYQYRVDFLPDPDVTVIKKGLLAVHREELGAYMFDGTVLWTFHRIDENQERISTRRNTNEPTRILFKLTTDLRPGDPNYHQFLNVVFRKVLDLMGWKIVGRDYFDPSNRVELAQHSLDIWPGYSTSIRQHEDHILLNVELGSKVMRRETAFGLMEVCRQRSGPRWKEDFEQAILRTTVITRYNNKTYKVDDIDWKSSPASTFDMRGNRVSYIDYYRTKYEINIRHTDQPLLVSNPSKRDIRAGRNEVVKLVPEICCLTGIDDAMRANFTLMRAIAEHTKVAPRDRVTRIEDNFLRTLMTREDTGSEMNRWRMSFNPKVVQFRGRQLKPETITIGANHCFPADGLTADFTKPLTQSRKPLLDAPELTQWVVIYPKRVRDQEVMAFVDTLKRASSSFQFRIANPRFESIPDDRGPTYAQSIENWTNQRAALVMCIAPNNNTGRYEAIKKKCYVNRSIPCQVVLGKNVGKNNMSICTKIGIQMVCKLGGTPWAVTIPWKNTMVVGFDVCHDTKDRERSFGALVASVNGNYSRYASYVYPHNRGEELSNHIGLTLHKAMVAYKERNRVYPDRIIFYRDGVGEGNFHYVQAQEVEQIKIQLRGFYGERPVPLVYTVVSKRINTRLFRDDNSNPLPGTIADSCVTLPHLFDFFLVSQSVKEGTVAPTSYVVLADEINVRPDHLQQITYKLCHLYYNWSGTVRVPAPVQYAHKLAFLSGQYLHCVPQGAEQNMADVLYFL